LVIEDRGTYLCREGGNHVPGIERNCMTQPAPRDDYEDDEAPTAPVEHVSLSDPEFKTQLAQVIPHLRAFGRSLSGSRDLADDLVQETLLKAWAAQDRFVPGTHLSAWLYTILRNSFYSEHQKRAREVGDPDGVFAASLVSLPAQQGALDLHDLQAALDRLVPDQREALLLSAVHDLSYEDIATAMECRVGTVKSRINRARARLAELLD